MIDEAGQPIAGAKVKVWGYPGAMKDKRELVWMVGATTDAVGQWRARNFRAMKFAHLYLTHPDYLADDHVRSRWHGQSSATSPPQPDDQSMARLRDFADVQVMKRGVSLTGKVVDPQGKAIPGAEVGWFKPDDWDTFHDDMMTTMTDAEGGFRFTQVASGRVVVQVKARGYAPGLQATTAEPLVITLGEPRALTGRVLDWLGQPMPNVAVTVDTWRNSRALGVFLQTGIDGRFRWDDAPADAVLINVGRSGFERLLQQRVSPADGEVLLTLRRSLSISGVVRDSVTGQSVDQVQMDVGDITPGIAEIAWNRSGRVFGMQGRLQGGDQRGNGAGVSAPIQGEWLPDLRVAGLPERRGAGGIQRQADPVGQAGGRGGFGGRPPAGWATPRRGRGHRIDPHTGRYRLPSVHLVRGKIQPDPSRSGAKTDAEGRFTLYREPDPEGKSYAVVVVHADYYAEVPRAALEAGAAITARPWGRIEGIARIGGKPASGAELRSFLNRLGNPDVAHISDTGKARADADGFFALDHVVPGDVRVSLGFGEGRNLPSWSNGTLVEVRAGETARVEVGGTGRPVIARIAVPDGFDPKADYAPFSEFELQSDRPSIPYPPEILASSDGSMATWGTRWWESAEGRAYRRNWFHLGQAKLQPDGTIRVDDVPPGEHRLSLTYSADPIYGQGSSAGRFAFATRQFTIPPIPGGRTDEPFDLGTLHPQPKLPTPPPARGGPADKAVGLGTSPR